MVYHDNTIINKQLLDFYNINLNEQPFTSIMEKTLTKGFKRNTIDKYYTIFSLIMRTLGFIPVKI
jgi:hypothetical protein